MSTIDTLAAVASYFVNVAHQKLYTCVWIC